MDHDLSEYRDALAFLFARTGGGSKLGLERTEALLHALGDPHRSLRAFHVAGTNGKGSVCATLEALLLAQEKRVGKYTSPHLIDFRERVLVNRAPVSEEFVVEFIRRWTPEVERLGATFFEATTALAFAWFERAEVDVAVVETGLGGRLDSTNVVRPLVAGVTSIGIDHVEFLGATREQIAFEKAGIFKPDCPAAIGERDETMARLLMRFARERSASDVRWVEQDAKPGSVMVDDAGTHFTLTLERENVRVSTPLPGAHQAWNTALAILMTTMAGFEGGLPDEARLSRALASVRLPGRFQRVDRYVLDVAHNPDGARVLAETLKAVLVPRPVAILLSVLADKDWRGIMEALAPVADFFVLTEAPTAPASRAWRATDAATLARERGWEAVLEPDFDRALQRASMFGATVVVTGSFHTVGDAMTRLQVDPLAR